MTEPLQQSLIDKLKMMVASKRLSHRVEANGFMWLAADEVYDTIAAMGACPSSLSGKTACLSEDGENENVDYLHGMRDVIKFLSTPKPVSIKDIYCNDEFVRLVCDHDNSYESLKDITRFVLDKVGVAHD